MMQMAVTTKVSSSAKEPMTRYRQSQRKWAESGQR